MVTNTFAATLSTLLQFPPLNPSALTSARVSPLSLAELHPASTSTRSLPMSPLQPQLFLATLIWDATPIIPTAVVLRELLFSTALWPPRCAVLSALAGLSSAPSKFYPPFLTLNILTHQKVWTWMFLRRLFDHRYFPCSTNRLPQALRW